MVITASALNLNNGNFLVLVLLHDHQQRIQQQS